LNHSLINKNNMSDDTTISNTTKSPRTRTPRNADSVTKGALALDLAARVELKKVLEDSITDEVKELKAKADIAAHIANGQS
jgi:hypothetical protein